MKITFVTTHLRIYGGGSKFLVDYANELIKRGHDITVVAQKINYKHFQFDKDIKIIEIGGLLPSSVLYWFNFIGIKKKYVNILNKLSTDFLISVHFPTNYFCYLVKRKKELKYLHFCLEPYLFFHKKAYYRHESFLRRVILWFFRKIFAGLDIKGTQQADEIICISKFTKKQVRAIYKRDGILHYLGVKTNITYDQKNFNLKKKLKIAEDAQILLALGLTHYLKGAKELLFIYNRILKEIPEAILLIGGNITKENQIIINFLEEKLKLPPNKIVRYGFIKQESLNEIYAQSALTIYTAIQEPFGLIPLESMINGTPVIAFNLGGPNETIINGKTGFLAEPYNYSDFAQKAIKIVKNKDLQERFANNAVRHIKSNFNLKTCINNFESILINIKNFDMKNSVSNLEKKK